MKNTLMKTSIVACSLLWSTIALAQVPDPFDAYEAQSGEKEKAPAKPTTQAKQQAQELNPSVDPLYDVLAEGRWTLSGMSAFSYDRNSNELLNGATVENSTYLLRLDLGLGYNLFDRLQIELVGGSVIRRLARENGAAPARDWLIQGRTRYTLPITGSVGLTGGLALGGYFGSSEREVQISGDTINETTSTYGLATDTLLGLTYALNDHLALHMLGNLAWFWGKESVPSADVTLSASSLHVGLTLGLGYTF